MVTLSELALETTQSLTQ